MSAQLLQRQAMDKHGIVATMDVNGKILSANDKCSQLSGFSIDEIIGENISAFDITNMSEQEKSDIFVSLSQGQTWQGEVHSLTKLGEPWYVFATLVPVFKSPPRVAPCLIPALMALPASSYCGLAGGIIESP